MKTSKMRHFKAKKSGKFYLKPHFHSTFCFRNELNEFLGTRKKKAPCHQDREANVKIVVPGARVELAWISPNDFESFASTIPPARHGKYYI